MVSTRLRYTSVYLIVYLPSFYYLIYFYLLLSKTYLLCYIFVKWIYLRLKWYFAIRFPMVSKYMIKVHKYAPNCVLVMFSKQVLVLLSNLQSFLFMLYLSNPSIFISVYIYTCVYVYKRFIIQVLIWNNVLQTDG